MIFEVQSYALIFQDMVYSLGVGFLVGFINQLLAVFLYKNKKAVFVRDIIMSIIFTVLVFSYTVSFANYKVLRWYNVLFALIGLILFTPCFSKGGHLLVLLFASLVVFMLRTTKRCVFEFFSTRKEKIRKNLKQTNCEKSDEVLKTEDILLYN